MSRRIIIDTDPGIDDALALFLAMVSSELDIQGITCVAGNVPIERVLRNARDIVELAGRSGDFPICGGLDSALIARFGDGAYVHGENGMGNVVLPTAGTVVDSRVVMDFIREKAQELDGDLEIVALGPLTNVGAALLFYPELKGLLKRIVIMGGSTDYGNVTEAAEFNIFADPHAAAIVFESGVPVDMYGLNVTRQAVISIEEREKIGSQGGEVGGYCSRMLDFYAEFYKRVGNEEPCLHDPFVMACVIDEGLAQMYECPIVVETRGRVTMGKTVADLRGWNFLSDGSVGSQHGGATADQQKTNTRAAMSMDREGFIALLLERLSLYRDR